jgi:hypothetical protein
MASLLFFMPLSSTAAITTGDIAVIGFNSDGGSGLNKDFTVVTLASIVSGETFYITDRGISSGTFNNSFTSEGTITFSVTSTIPAGTVIMFTVTSGSSPSVVANPSSFGTISVSGWTATIPGNSPWSGTGDQILIYQTGPTFIFGFNNTGFGGGASNGWHTGSSTSNAFSNIPPGLTNGTNAIGFIQGTHVDNVIYSGTITGNKTSLLTAITNSSNWTSNDVTAYDITPGGTSFPGTNPIFNFGTLPVHLISFTGTKDQSSHRLTWNVQNEDNFSRYEIEACTDGISFRNIGQVNASGKQQYSFTNISPALARNNYRLKMIDIDGRYSYSKVIMLLNADDTKDIVIYPNPASLSLNISSSNKINDIILTDINGRQVLRTVVNSNTLLLDISRQLPGVYQVQINTTKGIISKRITKSE